MDDRACATCRYLAPPPAPGSKEAVADAEIVRREKKGGDGDVEMGMNDLVSGLEKLNVSWLEGFKHRYFIFCLK